MDDGNTTREALARQLAAIEQLQREIEQKLRGQVDAMDAAPAAPWLARRGAANNATAPRTLPPWLARRGR